MKLKETKTSSRGPQQETKTEFTVTKQMKNSSLLSGKMKKKP